MKMKLRKAVATISRESVRHPRPTIYIYIYIYIYILNNKLFCDVKTQLNLHSLTADDWAPELASIRYYTILYW